MYDLPQLSPQIVRTHLFKAKARTWPDRYGTIQVLTVDSKGCCEVREVRNDGGGRAEVESLSQFEVDDKKRDKFCMTPEGVMVLTKEKDGGGRAFLSWRPYPAR